MVLMSQNNFVIDLSTWRESVSACDNVLIEGLLQPSKVFLLVLILSRSFCTAGKE